MIPKIIHTCWFGGSPLPEQYKFYLKTWKEKNPDFEIIVWNEKTFEKYFDDSEFVKFCIKNKKYAFLSDFFRLKVLYEFGGIYMDTDVECLRNLENFLTYDFVIGYIFDSSLGTAVLFSSKKNQILMELLDKFENKFLEKKDVTVSNDIFTEYFVNEIEGFVLNGKNAILNNIAIFQKDYFERMKTSKKSEGGYCLHHCDGTRRKKGFKSKILKPVLKTLIGRKKYEIFVSNYLNKKQRYYNLYIENIRKK